MIQHTLCTINVPIYGLSIIWIYVFADWGAVATISTRKDVPDFPVANLISIADGPVGDGTGIPYMYLTPLDYTAQDLAVSIVL